MRNSPFSVNKAGSLARASRDVDCWVCPIVAQTEGASTRRTQARPGDRVAAGEQRDVVSEVDQRLGEIRNNPLRSAMQPRWHALVQRRDLGDSQLCLPLSGKRPAEVRPHSARFPRTQCNTHNINYIKKEVRQIDTGLPKWGGKIMSTDRVG